MKTKIKWIKWYEKIILYFLPLETNYDFLSSNGKATITRFKNFRGEKYILSIEIIQDPV